MAIRKTPTFFLAAALGLCLAACAPRINDVDTSDPGITARIKGELKSHSLANVRFLDINSHMGIVTLSGMVESADDKREIERLVRHIDGVQQLVNNLVVQE